MLQKVTDESFHDEVREAEQPVVVLFKATWCNPCKEFTPLVEDLAGKMTGFKFVTIDLDESPKTTGDMAIRTVPSLALFNDGMVRDVLVGRHPKQEVRHWINDNH
ncbi:thioredoxin domain [Roseobacter phage RD-1410W1-01]|uniref:Thioredoxin n=1 Tax=Roseobacter phage RD-1410W1-01 TaxID=1815984 RepID=A0A191VYI2_9CAUD|nr:thioredoxin domain [Roseobacter phage RD-1410W1-01]ANJ20777.1 thioredoxin [Roseobacter phage RD-1410W1-01]